MYITFSTEAQEQEPLVFMDRDAWESHKRTLYACAPRLEPAAEPSRFPCLAMAAGTEFNPNGADLEHYSFIYDFQTSK